VRDILEVHVQKAIVDYLRLALEPPAFFFAIAHAGGGKRATPKAPGFVSGIPDLLIVYGGRAHFIEVKRPGGKLSPAQKLAISGLRAAGADCAVVESVEDVQALLSLWVIPHRRVELS